MRLYDGPQIIRNKKACHRVTISYGFHLLSSPFPFPFFLPGMRWHKDVCARRKEKEREGQHRFIGSTGVKWFLNVELGPEDLKCRAPRNTLSNRQRSYRLLMRLKKRHSGDSKNKDTNQLSPRMYSNLLHHNQAYVHYTNLIFVHQKLVSLIPSVLHVFYKIFFIFFIFIFILLIILWG